jgi:L-methionine (R)-S-oxide reductase
MHTLNDLRALSKPAAYDELATSLQALLAGEKNLIARAANMSSLLYWSLPDLNWAGFYLLDDESGDLIVGPFQGKPACVRIPLRKGVCGTAALQRRTLVVPDVHEFPGHIACDSASNSEIVVPVIAGGHLLGVLDLDSPLLDRFDQDDARGLEGLVAILVDGLETRR